MSASRVVQRLRAELSKLSEVLVRHQASCFERNLTLFAERQPFIKQLTCEVCSKDSSFLTVGSMISKLSANDQSDVDLAFVCNKTYFRRDFFGNEEFKIYFIDQLVNIITGLGDRYSNFRLIEPIISVYHTKVPLIIVKFKNGLSFDIQFPRDNMQSIRNTHLMKGFVEADKRFPQLYFWVRALFDAMGLKNSKDGLFSSYHIILLQSDPNVLPVLVSAYPELFANDVPMNIVVRSLYGNRLILPTEWKSENTREVGELVVEFVDYYANRFDPNRQQIIVGTGLAQDKRTITSHDLGHRLEIYDPYAPNSVCRSDILPDVFSNSFSYIWKELSDNGKFIDSFPEFTEEAKAFRAEFAKYPWGKLLQHDAQVGPDACTTARAINT